MWGEWDIYPGWTDEGKRVRQCYICGKKEYRRITEIRSQSPYVRAGHRRPGVHFRVRWSYLFIAIWIAAFGLGLYTIPTISLFYLTPLALFNALIVYVFIWGVAGVRRRSTARKVFGVLLILVLGGLAYQNYSVIPTLGFQSVAGTYQGEVAYLQSSGSVFQGVLNLTNNVGAGVGNIIRGYPSFNPSNPEFTGTYANVTYPMNYTTLANYALSLINQDRAPFGEPPLTLSTVSSAQQHADSMDYFGYFEHVDNQGYTPEQRFKMLGGAYGLIGENQGQSYCINSSDIQSSLVSPVSCNLQTIENGIANSEWGMMYNDEACCNNGHRMNILSSQYTQVAIGIAYDNNSNEVWFVEDFWGPCPVGYICP